MSEGLRFSCLDWEKRLKAKDFPMDLDEIYPHLNQNRIEKAEQIFGRLRIPDLVGQPQNFEAAGDWFFDIVRLAAGGLQTDNTQLIQNLLVAVPKKNSKTSAGAALILTLLMMTPRPNAEFLLVGPTQAISDTAFRQASGIILADPELKKMFRIREHLKRIEHIPSGAFLAIKSFDDKIVTGSKPSTVLLDECHLLSTDAASRTIGQLKGAGAAIGELQIIGITTMSDRAPSGWWKQEIAKARGVRDGEIDLSGYCPLIWEPTKDDSKDLASLCQPEVWEYCNPNLGKSVSLKWLKNSFKEAFSVDEVEVTRWLSQHTNASISTFATSDRNWPGALFWEKGAHTDVTMDWILENCDRVALGFDGGGLDDLTSLAIIGMIQGSDIWHCHVQSYCDPIALDRRKSIAGLLKDFEADGDLVIDSSGREISETTDVVKRLYDNGTLQGLGCDPAGIASELADDCEAAEIPKDQIIAVAQGFHLRAGYLQLERRVKSGKLFHGNQPILNWAVTNTQTNTGGLVTKKDSGTGKIDPIVALATAAIIAIDAPEPVGKDVAWMVGAVAAFVITIKLASIHSTSLMDIGLCATGCLL